MNIIERISPNQSPTTYKKDVIILHKTLGGIKGDLQTLTDPNSGVSSNWLVTETA